MFAVTLGGVFFGCRVPRRLCCIARSTTFRLAKAFVMAMESCCIQKIWPIVLATFLTHIMSSLHCWASPHTRMRWSRAKKVQNSEAGSSVVGGDSSGRTSLRYCWRNRWRKFDIILAVTITLALLPLIVQDSVLIEVFRGG